MAGEASGWSCCIDLLAERVILQLEGLVLSLGALGDVTTEDDGVLEGVGVLSDSSESLSSCDFPLQILSTIGGLGGSVAFVLFTLLVLSTVFSGVFERKNFLGEELRVVHGGGSKTIFDFLGGWHVGDLFGNVVGGSGGSVLRLLKNFFGFGAASGVEGVEVSFSLAIPGT